jgi:hypothetical protein
MHCILVIVFALAQLANPAWAPVTYDAELGYVLPEVVVKAERYAPAEGISGSPTQIYFDPILGWTLPTMIVNASRYEPLDPEAIAGYLLPRMAFADHGPEIKTVFASQTFSGSYTLNAGDTLRDDLTITGGSANINGVVLGDLTVMGGEAYATGRIEGDAAVFGGNLLITGTITGDAAVMGGNIRNKGVIEGEIFVMGGQVTLDSGSVVKGEITTIGGNVTRDTSAQVMGEIKEMPFENLQKYLPRFSKIWQLRPHMGALRAVPNFIGVFAQIVFFLLNLLILAIFPAGVEKISHKITTNIWLAVAIGIAFEILFIPAVILFAVSIIGIPLIPALFLAVLVAILFGVTALSSVVGEKIVQGFKWSVKSRVGIFSLGWIALQIIPILGMIISGLGFPLITIILGFPISFVITTIALGATSLALFKKEIEGK